MVIAVEHEPDPIAVDRDAHVGDDRFAITRLGYHEAAGVLLGLLGSLVFWRECLSFQLPEIFPLFRIVRILKACQVAEAFADLMSGTTFLTLYAALVRLVADQEIKGTFQDIGHLGTFLDRLHGFEGLEQEALGPRVATMGLPENCQGSGRSFLFIDFDQTCEGYDANAGFAFGFCDRLLQGSHGQFG